MEVLRSKYFRFQDFELDGTKRLLSRNGNPIALHSKTFDLLLALVEHRGEVLSKNQLLDMVWAGQFVEEGNLKVQISALRKIFRERNGNHRFIVTVPGRGYSFVADLDDETECEFVVETHTVSRLTIDQFTEEGEQSQSAKDLSMSFLLRFLTAGFLLVLGSATIWYYISWNYKDAHSARSGASGMTQRVFTTSGGGFPERVTISSDGKTIAYVEGHKGQTSLWVGETESNRSIQIVPSADRIYDYLRFTPDDKYIYFTAHDDRHPVSTLMRVSVFGGAIQELLPGVGSFFTFSPKGDSVAYLKNDSESHGREIVVTDAETGKESALFHPSDPVKAIVAGGISWSPDGSMIAFAGSVSGEDGIAIFGLNTADGTVAKIAGPVSNRIVNLAWLSDGKGLLINRNTANDARDGTICMVTYPDGHIVPITTDAHNYSLFSLSVSDDDKVAILEGRIDPQIWIAPAGSLESKREVLSGTSFRGEGLRGVTLAPDRKVLFVARSANGETIWETDLSGGEQRQLTPAQNNSVDSQLEATSDNRFLVFESTRSGKSEIWRANRDGGDLRQLTSGGGNSEPTVSCDGRWVIYTSFGADGPTLQRVSIDGGEPHQLTSDAASWPAISPDGRIVACVRSPGDGANEGGIGLMPFDGGGFLKTFKVPPAGILYNRIRWSPDGRSIIYKDVMQGLWRQDLTKDAPEHLAGLEDFRIVHLGFSNSDMIFSGGPKMREIMILEHFR